MISTIDPQKLRAGPSSKLYLDYIADRESALEFYSLPAQGFARGLAQRRAYDLPRSQVSALVRGYNERLGAEGLALSNADALSDPETFCVIAGQQAGFVGGPAYTAYKIMTTIRLAAHLQEQLHTKVIPVFWLATEDHDFEEINHTYYVRPDGEIGRVRFDWEGAGRPVADLSVTDDVLRAYGEYVDSISPGPHVAQVQEWFGPRSEGSYGEWQAHTWLRVFSRYGLLVVEPRVIRPAGVRFFRFALEHSDRVNEHLESVSHRLADQGYEPALTSNDAGQLYTFGSGGQRMRVDDPAEHLDLVATQPERYSTDAALRPLFADALLPVLSSVLGPGEVAYQGMLKPLYELFAIPQPVLFPRKSYTVVSSRQAERMAAYGLDAGSLLAADADSDAVFQALVPSSEQRMFARARDGVEEALSPLRPYLEGIDPSLGRTWEQTLGNATRGLDKLEERGFKARLSQLGFSKGELRALQNAVLPRGRLQERVLPLPHFVSVYGPSFIGQMMEAGELLDFGHHIVILGVEDA